MTETLNNKQFDLEERAFNFAKKVFDYVNALPKTITNVEIGKQLTRSAGSLGANYIEANESLGKKDFIMRIKISRKEAKESRYWLNLSTPDSKNVKIQQDLVRESTELMNIFGAILNKSQ